jgi:hypothetical protein
MGISLTTENKTDKKFVGSSRKVSKLLKIAVLTEKQEMWT